MYDLERNAIYIHKTLNLKIFKDLKIISFVRCLKGVIYDPVNINNYVEDTKVTVSIKKLMPTNAH